MSAVVSDLKAYYFQQVVPELMKVRSYKNIHQVPKLEKIVLNSRINADEDKAYVEQLTKDMGLITGQKAIVRKAKKSVSNFKLRQGMPVGVQVTLRGARMHDFLFRLIHIVLPVVLDFRGVSRRMDKSGNLNIGVTDYSVFPEIKIQSTVRKNRGLDIAIVTSTDQDKEAFLLLEALGVVFRK
jgi:large subunit ribosomal protein L5